MANHNQEWRVRKVDPFLMNYNANDLKIASEFLCNWLPFLSRGLCNHCTTTLSDRIRSLETNNYTTNVPLKQEDMVSNGFPENHHNCDVNDTTDINSIGSWKDDDDGYSQHSMDIDLELSTPKETNLVPRSIKNPTMVKMSWADMAQEDEIEAQNKPKMQLSREQREQLRFNNIQRKKDFICLEHVKGKIVNILDGLELHTGVFSAAEQKRIVQYVEELRQMGQNGQLKDRTYTAPKKWMKGKGRVTIQFGCCYNYAMDRKGNPPGILKNDELVDPIPHLLKVMIKRMVMWHVIPPTCVPDSCIINIYEEGDCIPPHIDSHDFVRPFCTVSFLSECDIVFRSNLKIVGPGEFVGSFAIPLPVGSVLVMKGNGADVAKHCVPAVPTKRISITFRRMDESKRPNGYVPKPDLQGVEPLSIGADKGPNIIKPSGQFTRKQSFEREDREQNSGFKINGSTNRRSESRQFTQNQCRPRLLA